MLKNFTRIVMGGAALLAALLVWRLGPRSVAAEAVYPVENGAGWFSRQVVSRVRGVFSRMDLAAENRRLREEAAALRMELIRFAGRRPAPADGAVPRTWLAAPVLSRGGVTGARGFLRLGKGSADGVKTGLAVAVPEGLVGRVTAVSPHTCEVRLITDPSVRVACEVLTGVPAWGPVYGILSGGGAHRVSEEAAGTLLYVINPLRLRHLDRQPELPPRAKIITSGQGGIFPRGLVVGFLLDEPREDESKLEREGEVEPAVDFPSLESVFICRET